MKPLLFALLFTLIIHPIVLLVKTVIKKKKEKTQAQLKAKLWKLVSFYVRKSAADFQGNVSCYTCGKVDDWRAMDCGHFIPKSVGGAALYHNLANLRIQCVGCNRFRHGNLTVYAMKLEKEQPGILDELHALRGQSWSKKQLEADIEKFTKLTKTLR
jgi:hypothetical protein